jgi:hypothetical protein
MILSRQTPCRTLAIVSPDGGLRRPAFPAHPFWRLQYFTHHGDVIVSTEMVNGGSR